MSHTDPAVLAILALGESAGIARDDAHTAQCADCQLELDRLAGVGRTGPPQDGPVRPGTARPGPAWPRRRLRLRVAVAAAAAGLVIGISGTVAVTQLKF